MIQPTSCYNRSLNWISEHSTKISIGIGIIFALAALLAQFQFHAPLSCVLSIAGIGLVASIAILFVKKRNSIPPLIDHLQKNDLQSAYAAWENSTLDRNVLLWRDAQGNTVLHLLIEQRRNPSNLEFDIYSIWKNVCDHDAELKNQKNITGKSALELATESEFDQGPCPLK